MNKQTALSRFKRQKDEIEKLKIKEGFSSDFKKWRKNTEILIENAFGQDTRHINDFKKIRFGLLIYSDMTADKEVNDAFCKGLDKAKSIIESYITEINEYWEEVDTKDINRKKSEPEDNILVGLLKNSSKEIWNSITVDFDINKRAFGRKISFVEDEYKRKIIFRDVEQAYILSKNGFSKSAVILSGSVIEELLRLYLKYKKVTPAKNTFEEYIKACENSGLLKSAISLLSDSVRHFRNFVHLEKEKSSKHAISKSAATGAVSSIFTIANDF